MINLTNPPTDLSQITNETAPTTRADGSALQVGDRWYKPSESRVGSWNGTLWLTQKEDMVIRTGVLTTLSATNAAVAPAIGFISLKSTASNLLFIHKTIVFGRCGLCTDVNRWEIATNGGLLYVNRGGSVGSATLSPAVFSTTTINNQASLWTHEQDYNAIVAMSPVGTTEGAIFDPIRISATKFGSAPNLLIEAFSIEYSRVML